MKSVMIHQPEYLPWPNLFLKAALADVFVLLDTVQYARRSFQNRNKIKTKDGAKWLTVPLKQVSREQLILDMEIDNSKNWKEKHLRLIDDSYKRSVYYSKAMPLLKPLYEKSLDNLSELNCALIMKISENLGIRPKFIKASELKARGKGSELILNICVKLGATRYISGVGAKAYLNEESFKKNAIDITFIPPKKMEYKQIFPEKGFIQDLSIIDYMFNIGSENFLPTFEKFFKNHRIKKEVTHG